MVKLAVCALVIALLARGADLSSIVDSEMPSLLAAYKTLHQHPELSQHEEHTSAFLATELRKAGYDVTEHVGRYANGTPAWGVVAVLHNGPGHTLLIRTELDALPVEEKTGLAYSSLEPGVMHACGHDIHMTSLLGTGRALAALKDQWHGTLMLIGQPAEEMVGGAKAMVSDHLYERFGRPDSVIALHDDPRLAAGTVGITSGPVFASSTLVEVTMRGVGGHGAQPQATKDPVVMAAEFVVALQTIVSRQIPPQSPAVVTVGSIHGGTRANIIPDEVKLAISVRAFSEETRTSILAGIKRIADGIALAAGVPTDRAPIVNASADESTPVTYNDPALAARLRAVWVRLLGPQNVIDVPGEMVSEDVGRFGLDGHQIPVFMMRLGAVDPGKLRESQRTGKALPSLHSSLWAPVPEPTIETGIRTTTAAALDLLQ